MFSKASLSSLFSKPKRKITNRAINISYKGNAQRGLDASIMEYVGAVMKGKKKRPPLEDMLFGGRAMHEAAESLLAEIRATENPPDIINFMG